ncbi:GNAT family N-acetyltransferase [Microbacterium koreense]|uniref:GNAT family N-acetyltransferase n=1 Tax=Microbacterium koreense TaxID=323761 RepID=A0ABW2ZQU8_9MICO
MSVVLRPWTSGDASALSAAFRSAADLATQFGGTDLSTPAMAEAFIDRSLRFDESVKNWAVVEDDVAIGNVGVSVIEFRHETAWMHYWLAAGARGRGYATAALIAASDWAFENGLYRLELGHRVNNPASCRVATAAGFLAEGVEREKLRYGDVRYDVETHARLATDPAPVTNVALVVAE